MAASRGPKRLALGCVVLLASAAALEGAFVQSLGRVCPVDEAVGIESLARFREQLRDAVKARDVEMLRPLVDPGIVVGGLSQQFKVGFEAFLDHFEFRDRSNSIWTDVGGVLWQGGILEGDDAFCAPYFVCQSYWPWGGGTVVILGEDVLAYARPDRSTKVVARLSCDVLRVASGDELAGVELFTGWRGVHLPSGAVGFVESDRVAHPSLLLRIGKKAGQWRLIHLQGTD